MLDIGCSAGAIDYWLADKVQAIYGVDIDVDILHAVKEIKHNTANFTFIYAGGDQLPFRDKTFDIIISNIMYYLLSPSAQQKMLEDIYRCLKPHGLCYFAAPNRLMLLDGKFKLPFLLWLPKSLGKIYARWLSPVKEEYNEYHKTLFGIRKMLQKQRFFYEDMTLKIIDQPEKYHFLTGASQGVKLLVRIFARVFYVFSPNYIFILRKKEGIQL